MLYVTTRNKFDTYTVHRANQSDRGPDGGLFLPFRMPILTATEILSLGDQTFGQRVAYVLNLLFGTQFTAWDVELCGGKNPVKLVAMNHRMLVAEVWHTHDLDFAYMERMLAARICGYADSNRKPTSWVGIAIRIAALFGIYGELLALGLAQPDAEVDISVATGDFTAPMAAWYAREMGLPLGNVVCCHEDSSVWDLIHHGEVRTDNRMPENLERLISAALGVEECLRYCDICENGRLYATRPGAMEALRKGMYATVVSPDRIAALIMNVYRMSGYIAGPQTALAYGGLQDYRAKAGENRLALLISERSPLCDREKVASCMEITSQELREKLGE